MKNIVIIILFLFSTVTAQTFKELQEIPKDSINAETMKIWIPVESDVCLVKVKILNNNNEVIRELLERRITKGYYNIYWDKKDDSGLFVEPGEYNIALISCNYRKMNPIKVNYQNGERAVQFHLDDITNPPVLTFDLLEDSINVSVSIVNKNDYHMLDLVEDTLITKDGPPKFTWSPRLNVTTGFYKYLVTINDFTHYIKFKYIRKAVKE